MFSFRLFLESHLGSNCFFFGTFNPIQTAHCTLAEQTKSQYGFHTITLIPVNIPPHKKDVASFKDRFNMCRLAAKEYGFLVSDIESTIKPPNYTIETLRTLIPNFDTTTQKIPFICGSDVVSTFSSWKEAELLANKLIFLQAPRDEFKFQKHIQMDDKQIPIETYPLLDRHHISSTLIRTNIKNGKSIAGLVPKSVEEYIVLNRLYV